MGSCVVDGPLLGLRVPLLPFVRPSLRSSPLLGGQSVVHSHKVGPTGDSVKKCKNLVKNESRKLKIYSLSVKSLYSI